MFSQEINEDSTVTYTEVSSPFEDLSDIGSLGVDGLPMMLEDPYVEATLQAPPSPDYVPGPDLRISTSGKDGSDKGYGTNSLLEQWRDSYLDNDDYDPYDDDMYENHDLSEHL
ncbi:hypothetical protein Tco_0025005 [Tanacetum coccineum]